MNNIRKNAVEPGWSVADASCVSKDNFRKSWELLNCIMTEQYEDFISRYADEVKDVKMKTFCHMGYFVNSVCKNPEQMEAMKFFIAKKNNAEALLDKKVRLSKAMDVEFEFDFGEFINNKSTLEKLEELMAYDVETINFYCVYALVDAKFRFAFSEQSWKEFYWAVDTIRAMIYGVCTPENAYKTFYIGLEDLRRDVA